MASDQAIRPLDAWLQSRLESTVNDDLRYESSHYGPINSLLTHVFPLHRRFMIKPQPKLRPIITNVDERVEGGERVSIDSMNNPVKTRAEGREIVLEPDFIAVKAGSEYGGDQALAVIEVKRAGKRTASDWDQIQRYMTAIFDKHPASDLKGYLVVGKFTFVYEPSKVKGIGAICIDRIDTAKELKGHLESHAVDHW